MARVYHRPAGLVFGPDARTVIEEGLGSALGGLSFVAYTMVEVIERGGTRKIVPYDRLSDEGHDPRIVSHQSKAWSSVDIMGSGPRRNDRTSGRDDLPLIMGIVNVTPDSFSDGGQHGEHGAAITHGLQLTREGAHILDVGGESTRPGSDGVPEQQELDRVIPVIEALAKEGLRVSCDTRKAVVMREALKAGAAIINDVSALQHDPASLMEMAKASCPVVLMHAQGDPRTMQLQPQYDDVALDVFDMLAARIADCVAAGIDRTRLIADPGIGFGKTFGHNLELLRQFTLFHGLGVPLLMGLSRKAFVGALTGEKSAAKRVHGSVGGAVWSSLNGAHILRVHDVKETVEALAVARAAADPEASGI